MGLGKGEATRMFSKLYVNFPLGIQPEKPNIVFEITPDIRWFNPEGSCATIEATSEVRSPT
jgi:hypothetical protein